MAHTRESILKDIEADKIALQLLKNTLQTVHDRRIASEEDSAEHDAMCVSRKLLDDSINIVRGRIRDAEEFLKDNPPMHDLTEGSEIATEEDRQYEAEQQLKDES